ncbi:hypothetical protein BDQ17DRAFT_1360120 [Cyathus striatus]|nr:hypothetical protein BDQ17DRAFT_1360120 [Cyathus striatus]
MLSKLLPLISLAVAASAAVVTTVVPPALKGLPNSSANTLSLDGTNTDTDSIVNTAAIVDQKAGANDDTPPNQPVPPTVVTAVDGQLTAAGTANATTRRDLIFERGPAPHRPVKRTVAGFEQVFAGTGTGPNDRDASIEGTAYLTYTVVPNATYNIDACLNFCVGVDGCVFANLYYEFNNELLDFVFNEQSNLKCAIYGDIHSAAEKLNFGGQQLEAPPAGLTFIQQSSGFAADSLVDPADPEGYELVFGPTNGANNAPGYMGFAFLDKYDVDACAQQCNTRGADPNGGACQYFNIWRAVVNGNPTTYTCSMYFLVADESTAVNTGQGDLAVTFSRGYKRKNFIFDGGFEGFLNCDDFCFASSYADWVGTSAPGGVLDATFFFFETFAHSGHGSALLGSANGTDNLPGTITPSGPLATVAGKTYEISFFQQSSFAGSSLESDAFFQVLWNGQIVQTVNVGFTDWKFFSFQVTAQGNDVFAISGGKAPAWSFIDDINIFEI